MNKILLVVLSTLFFITCNSPQVVIDENVKCFRDFDFFCMQGVSQLDPFKLHFPYTAVKMTDSLITLDVNYSLDNKTQVYLKKIDDYWVEPTDSIQEIDMQYFDRYYYKNKTYTVEYHTENGIKKLDQLIITEQQEQIIKHLNYSFSDEKILDNTLPWEIKYNDWRRKEEYAYYVSNGILHIQTTADFRGGKRKYDEYCYFIGNYPLNYFQYFGFEFKKIECPK